MIGRRVSAIVVRRVPGEIRLAIDGQCGADNGRWEKYGDERLGDTGYVISIEMGASKESLDHPQAHADIEGVFMRLVRSLKVERLAP